MRKLNSEREGSSERARSSKRAVRIRIKEEREKKLVQGSQ